MRIVQRIMATLDALVSIVIVAGCGVAAGGPVGVQSDGPLDVSDLVRLGDGLGPGEYVEVRTADLEAGTREVFADVVERAETGGGVVRVAGYSHDHALESRGSSRCYSSVVFTAHRPDCTGSVTKYWKYATFYPDCPHPGYVTKNPGLLVTALCTDSRCEYIAKYAIAYHTKA
jgi:hypothetical protein